MQLINIVIMFLSFIFGLFFFNYLLSLRKEQIEMKETTVEEKKGLIGLVKRTISLHKGLLKIQFLGKRMNHFWVRLGRPSHFLPEDMMVMKLIFAFLTFFLLFFIMKIGTLASTALFTLLAFFVPDLVFNAQVQRRQEEIRLRIPEMIDILNLCVEAGLDFMAAVSKYINTSEKNSLREEMEVMVQEVQLGSSRREAMRNMAGRIEISEIDSFASVVIQSEELGTSLTVLQGYAEEIRVKRWQKAEKLAAEAPTKMLFPMMIFVFPGVFLLIFGPMLIQLLTQPMFK